MSNNMSKDRVVFQVPIKRLLDMRYVDCLLKAFGLSRWDVPVDYAMQFRDCHTTVTWEITCRPSQFARFIILRADSGCQNLIQELKARLVQVAQPASKKLSADPVDVSHNPAKHSS